MNSKAEMSFEYNVLLTLSFELGLKFSTQKAFKKLSAPAFGKKNYLK
jgi:hypothetical protein